MSQLLTTVANRFRTEAAQKEITLCFNIIPGLYSDLDKSYTDQVFQNLISNAIKFSPSNKSVFVNLGPNQEFVRCEIKDEGPGLNEEDKKKLFGKYQKLSAKPTGNETSTGLGLSIVKKFVEAMKGRIWCESEAGKGASFFVEFKSS